jgi:YetA-like protein
MRALFLLLLGTLTAQADVALHVRETAGVARAGEVVRSGIPLPRTIGQLSTDNLRIVDANGVAVPAQFKVLARWNAGRSDAAAPIQWLLVSFPATAGANGTAAYRLTAGTNPAPPTPLQLMRDGNRVVVDTGAAVFTIDGGASSLFEEIRWTGNPACPDRQDCLSSTAVITGGTLTARIDGADGRYTAPRAVTIEDAGPLSAVVLVEGTYDLPSISSQRRYVFTAGSATAIVRQTLAWEGRRCDGAGVLTCGAGINAVRVQRMRNTLNVAVPAATVQLTGARGSTAVQTEAPASLAQRLRANRTTPRRYEIGSASGEKADGALLSAGPLSIALDRMHEYEPQALHALADGSLAIDTVAEQTWLGARQALFATMAVGAGNDPEREVWAPLNHPLRAWPDAAAFASSEAADPFPAGRVSPEHEQYDTAVRRVLEATVAKRDELGLHGLMTFGLFPRIWGNPIYSDEVQCGDDPTPGEAWDDLYWCGTWTDYHNTSTTAAVRAMRTGEVEWLDAIARPAALRMLYTQVFRCAPGDPYFYCGQAPAGYGGYRADFNSSHAYFDNLQLYYWLTGDSAVVETLQRGARPMREYLCSRRPAAPCQPHDPPIDEWANLTGRVASQWAGTFRFVGLAGDDPSYLDDYRTLLARAVTQQYLSLGNHGFLLAGWRPVTAAGRVTTDQLWMTALYDMKNLDRLRRDTNDAPIGDPPIRPSEVIAAYGRTIAAYVPSAGWPNSLDVTWSGPRIGGTILSVAATPGGGDPFLYDTGRSTLAGPLALAARFDPSLEPFARELTGFAIAGSLADPSPLGKLQGEYLARLHAAVAELAPRAVGRRRAVR